MKQVYRFDENGYFIEPVIIYPDDGGNYLIPDGCTETELPEPNWKPVFDTSKGIWVETITDEELEGIQKPPNVPLPDTVILGQQMTEREIEAMEQGQKITDLEIQAMEQGQQATDMELRLIALEVKFDV